VHPNMLLVLGLMVDVAKGLVYLHDRGIMHCDIKPDNVLLKPDDSSPTRAIAKLTDYGLSRAMDPDVTHVSNWTAGTPFYIAPEVVLHHQLTKASDIYSLVCICLH
jgi:eukaryotic-like serine/threonine-protein kinase